MRSNTLYVEKVQVFRDRVNGIGVGLIADKAIRTEKRSCVLRPSLGSITVGVVDGSVASSKNSTIMH